MADRSRHGVDPSRPLDDSGDAVAAAQGGRAGSGGGLSRILDLTVAALALVVGAPVIAAVALSIRVQMGSPILFRQARAGKHGATFQLVKFRTMRAPPPGEEGFRPDTDEQRLTKLGQFLRSTSLDELPSMLNVLRGEMSIVGPRPLPVHYLPRYSATHARRHEVPPGITGWAQVQGRNTLSWDDQLDMDVWYVDHKSVALDARILTRTALTVLRRDGISQEGQATRQEFLGSGQEREHS